MIMLKLLSQRVAIGTLLLGIVIGLSPSASATMIDPGFDLFHTPGEIPPLVIGPLGPVAFESYAPGLMDFDGNAITGLGNTDTIIRRHTGLADGESGTIDIEIVALSLRSVDVVDLAPLGSPLGAGVNSYLYLTLAGSAGLGTMTVDHNNHTFDSFFDVFTEISLEDGTVIGTRTDTQTTTGATWSHTPPSGYPSEPWNIPLYGDDLGAGGFYVTGTTTHTGPHPETEPAGPIPEPSTLLILGMGLAGVATRFRKK